MTMPGIIWVSEVNRGYGEWQDVTDGMPTPTPYIRADLTNDLIEALETIHSQTNDGLARHVAGDALVRYRAIAD